MTPKSFLLAALAVALVAPLALADPCGMVPPITIQDTTPIARVGDQQTYVFYKDGVETFVIRPGFTGKVDEFGMLIPFPTPPALRKVPDDIFPQITKAIDPPEVVVYANLRYGFARGRGLANNRNGQVVRKAMQFAKKDEVKVLKEEAVGMYEVAVLEAGSAKALKRWMDQHKYKYPTGMDKVCEEYIEDQWCFVAVKTKVGQKGGVDPKPGMKTVNSKLPDGSTFDGHVQGMGFRFKVDQLVVPMRLSAFNEGELHNIVYLITDEPKKIRSIPEEYVVRQISGDDLIRHVTQPLPLRIIGGTAKDIPAWRLKNLPQQRDPVPHNGHARDLFASDMLTVKKDQLSHPHEEAEKMLLRIGERLGLRGPDVDKLNLASLAKDRAAAVKEALADLKSMTLTVIDGDFPREVLSGKNLQFAEYKMPSRRNSPSTYDAKSKQPAAPMGGVLKLGQLDISTPQKRLGRGYSSMYAALLGMVALGCMLVGMVTARRSRPGKTAAAALIALAAGLLLASPAMAQDKKAVEKEVLKLIDDLEDPKKADEAVKALVKHGKAAVPHLLGEALEGTSFIKRGWSIVALGEIGGDDVKKRLTEIYNDTKQPQLVRTWAAAAVVYQAETTQELLKLAPLINQFQALGRPIGMRLVDALKKNEKASAEDVINISLQVSQLRQHLAPAILAFGPDELIRVMTKSANTNVARQATAYLGTMAQKDRDAVAKKVIEVYKFDPKAKRVPWSTALWLPGINWGKDDGRELVDNLIRWHLWAELNNQKQQQRQVQNNIQGVGLARQVGYQPKFGNVTTEQWLTTWGQLVKRDAIEEILKQQNAQDIARFKKVLSQVPEAKEEKKKEEKKDS